MKLSKQIDVWCEENNESCGKIYREESENETVFSPVEHYWFNIDNMEYILQVMKNFNGGK